MRPTDGEPRHRAGLYAIRAAMIVTIAAWPVTLLALVIPR